MTVSSFPFSFGCVQPDSLFKGLQNKKVSDTDETIRTRGRCNGRTHRLRVNGELAPEEEI